MISFHLKSCQVRQGGCPSFFLNCLKRNHEKSTVFSRRVLALGESNDSFGVVTRRQAREIIKSPKMGGD